MIIVGTAGHIDHGKTSLVGSLTGMQTDRLKEEKERGISIELGFAYVDLGEERLGIVDVPGHERFVRQMIAGATGIDLVILVVAADEGVMQQTREHLDICRLLGIRRGLIALTKVDLVDEEWLELVESDLSDFVAGTFLESAPIVHFSAPNPATHTTLRNQLSSLLATMKAEQPIDRDNHPLRLPVDRIFTMRGFGTVVTGTVCSGTLEVGDSVTLLPGSQEARVRGIESHKESKKQVHSGQRAAINLQGVDKDDLSRGDVITHRGALKSTRMLNVDLHLLPNMPHALHSQSKALVHVGTSQVNGTISLLDRESLDPGDTAPAQIRLDQYVVCLGGDHIVLRGFELLETYGKTLGGGVIRHPLPTRARRNDATVLASMEALRGDYLPARIKHCALLTGQQGVTVAALKQVINATGKSTQQALDELLEAEELYRYVQDGTDVLLHHEVFEQLLSKALTTLQEYHGRYAHRAGMPREELRSQIRNSLPPRLFQKLVQVLSARDEIVIADTVLQKAGFVPTLSDTLQQLRADVLAEIKRGRLEPVPPDELRTRFSDRPNVSAQDVNEVLVLLAAEGHIIRVLERLIFAREHIEKLERDVVDFIRKNGQMTTPQLKEITGTSRKYTVPLAEYLDARKLTIRVGDARKLRQG